MIYLNTQKSAIYTYKTIVQHCNAKGQSCFPVSKEMCRSSCSNVYGTGNVRNIN